MFIKAVITKNNQELLQDSLQTLLVKIPENWVTVRDTVWTAPSELTVAHSTAYRLKNLRQVLADVDIISTLRSPALLTTTIHADKHGITLQSDSDQLWNKIFPGTVWTNTLTTIVGQQKKNEDRVKRLGIGKLIMTPLGIKLFHQQEKLLEINITTKKIQFSRHIGLFTE